MIELSGSKIAKVLLLFGIIFTLFSAFPKTSVAGNDDIKNAENDLNKVRQELKAKRDNLKTLSKNEKSVLKNIRYIEENIDLTNAFLRKLEKTSKLLSKKIKQLNRRIDSTSTELESSREVFNKGLDAVYKQLRRNNRWQLLLTNSLSESIREYHLSRSALEYEYNLIESIKEMINQISKKRIELINDYSELKKVKAERKRERMVLDRQNLKRKKLLNRIRGEKKLQSEAIAQLEKEAVQLEKILAELQSQSKGEVISTPDYKTAFYKYKGRLSWPVKGKVITRFGDIVHPIYKTKTFNPGIDISAPYGANVAASAAGKVAYIGYLRGYGNFIIIDHNEGYYTLYAKLSEIDAEVGEIVLKGDIIGKVGDAGDSGNPSLHFELRRGKKQYNPLKWLE